MSEFRPMRRAAQQLSEEETRAILRGATSGVLAVMGDGGYPYAVPLSFVYDGKALYFHCAAQGHKLDALRRCPKASFCVVFSDEVVPERYTTRYLSAVAFGTVRTVDAESEKRAAIEKLARKYAPHDSEAHRARYIEESWPRLCVLAMDIDSLTGKQGRELMAERAAQEGKR